MQIWGLLPLPPPPYRTLCFQRPTELILGYHNLAGIIATTHQYSSRPVRSSMTPPSDETTNVPGTIEPTPALIEQSVPALSDAFNKRFLLGTAAALALAVGGNLGGVTSLLLGFSPVFSEKLKLDVLYPVNGFKRCVDTNFEFLYPASWVGDQTLLYRAAQRADRERLFDIQREKERRQRSLIEPVVAFGPPGSSGELNVSVIVAPVTSNFKLEKFGGPMEAGKFLLDQFITSRSPNIMPALLTTKSRSDFLGSEMIIYYTLEFTVKGPSFLRHNIMVYAVHNGQLVTLNAQTPENLWPRVQEEFYKMADSFKVLL